MISLIFSDITCARELMLEAANHMENRNENILVESLDDDMETESIMYDDTSGDMLSLCVHFFNKFKRTTGQDVCALFKQFTTDGVEMNKIKFLIMQKSKLFFQLEKKRTDG